MAVPGLVVSEEMVDGACAITVQGDLDLRTAPDFCARLEAHRGQRVLVDLSDLEFCDSCGLRALMGEAREARFAGGRISVVAPRGSALRRLLELTGLTEALGVHADLAQALAVH